MGIALFCLAAAGELSASQALITEAYQIACRLNQAFFGAFASIWAGFTTCDLLDPTEACRWYETELAQPRTAKSASSRRMLLFHASRARLMMGAVAEPAPDLSTDGLYHALEAASAYLAGDWDRCCAAATHVFDLARSRGNRWVEFWAAHQLARLALAENEATGAEDLLERALELVAGRRRPWEALVNADLVVLYASLGRTDEARAALNRCRAAMRANEDWRGLAGRLQLGAAALSAAERRTTLANEHLTQAIGAFRRYHLPWDEAQALECWGASLIKSGDRKAGDRRLDAAATLYPRRDAGGRWLHRVARIRADARNGHTPDAPTGALSRREVEVLGLVAAGRSNQEIADALVLSVRTVERHLGHMYDKLGANGKSARAIAAAYGIANGLVPAPEA